MPRLKIMQLSLALALVASAVASGSASAVPEYIVEGLMIPVEVSVNSRGTSAVWSSTVNGKSILLECSVVMFSEGQFKSMGESTGKFKFGNCNLAERTAAGGRVFPDCTVPNFEFRFMDKLIAPRNFVEDELKPTAGVTFVTVKIEGTLCPALLAGNYKVEGTYVASFDPGIGVLGEEHILMFATTGSNITFGGQTASLSMIVGARLENDKTWFAMP
jgi:hypothetical protein